MKNKYRRISRNNNFPYCEHQKKNLTYKHTLKYERPVKVYRRIMKSEMVWEGGRKATLLFSILAIFFALC